MSVNESILNQTFNKFSVTGYVSEMGMLKQQSDGTWKSVPLQIVSTTRNKYVDGKKTEEKFKCEQLRGNIAIKTDTGVQMFRINFYSKKSDGTPNDKIWPMAKKIMSWTPIIGGTNTENAEPSYVSMEGDISIYDNVGKDGKMYSNLQYNVKGKCQHVDKNNPSGCSLTSVAYLKSFNKELIGTGENVRETGRLIVELYGADNRGQCYPIKCYVEASEAEEFEECFELGQTLDCEFDRVIRHVGGEKKKKKFSTKSTNVQVSNNYDVEELILVGADIIEEPEELFEEDEEGNETPVKTRYIVPAAMNKAIKIRQTMLEQKMTEQKMSGSNVIDSIQKAKSSIKNAKKNIIEEDLSFEDAGDIQPTSQENDEDDFDFEELF